MDHAYRRQHRYHDFWNVALTQILRGQKWAYKKEKSENTKKRRKIYDIWQYLSERSDYGDKK